MSKPEKLFVIFILWLFFPLMAIWLWVTHPGKCALIWKKETENSWFDNKATKAEG